MCENKKSESSLTLNRQAIVLAFPEDFFHEFFSTENMVSVELSIVDANL